MAFSKAILFEDIRDYNHIIAKYGRALGHPARVKLLRWLAKEGPRHPWEVSEYIQLSKATTSHHLSYLERNSLIRGVESGPLIEYHFESDHFAMLLHFFETLFTEISSIDGSESQSK